ncbi:MAG: TIGR03960 family B12-binding radical SAM protein [Clostridiales bacterium]|nr:TIGR03960 family B12-binding radical SAM protein [Clostridiales bacterium]
MLTKKHEKILSRVQKPGRYSGGEPGSIIKDKSKVDVSFAFCFPDTYEIGMSHLGMKILYSVLNEREDTRCERVFAPWTDMEAEMRKEKLPLYALESGDDVKDFDIIGFTLQYELSYTNLLNMLDLAGLPIKAEDRQGLAPLVVAGGPCVCNPEPICDFVDLFLPGEGEEVINDLVDLYKTHKAKSSSKAEFLQAAAGVQGIYVPSLYEVDYEESGKIAAVRAKSPAPKRVEKRIISDLDKAHVPENFVVPFVEAVHDRVTVEIFRGCIRGCRFCQAGFIYRPIREKSHDVINDQCKTLADNTGYDEVSLCSLSTSDYSQIQDLLPELLDWTVEEKVNISLPSLRADNFPKQLSERLLAVRRSGLTFAPEAGTQRLRDVINKNISREEILTAARRAFESGWTSVKLYFMIGLPTETEEDLEAIAQLAQDVVDEFYKNPNRPKGRGVSVSVSVAGFVPKPFTPFQWEAQDTAESFAYKQNFIKSKIKTRKINISFHNPHMSFLEGVLARGDRRLGALIEHAWRLGCRFDGWDDQFDKILWTQAFEECGLEPEFYASRLRGMDELLPWDHLDYGLSKKFLIREREKAYAAKTTPHCRQACAACGANAMNGGACHAIG